LRHPDIVSGNGANMCGTRGVTKIKISIVGGGINGLSIAWRLARRGHNVSLYEADSVLSKTSSASSKMLHGGIRYLETGQVSLVYQALKDRHWWITQAGSYVTIRSFYVPIYRDSPRALWKMFVGVKLYEWLSGRRSLGRSRLISQKEIPEMRFGFKPDGLKGLVSYFDAQMDERGLGLWVKHEAQAAGVTVFENSPVAKVKTDGGLVLSTGQEVAADLCVNALGPWAEEILEKSNILSKFEVELVRGSHLVIDRPWQHAFLLQVKTDQRVVFALPYEDKLLLGTTEVVQDAPDAPICSDAERDYLIRAFNDYFLDSISTKDILSDMSGLRPIIKTKKSHGSPSTASRESEIEINNRLVNIWGGKWTSAISLADKVTQKITKVFQ
jgi:glycerol-3-phosphate dehydrogenase